MSTGGADRDAARTIDLVSLGTEGGRYGPGGDARQPRLVRILITDLRSGSIKMNLQFPAGPLQNLATFVPQVGRVL